MLVVKPNYKYRVERGQALRHPPSRVEADPGDVRYSDKVGSRHSRTVPVITLSGIHSYLNREIISDYTRSQSDSCVRHLRYDMRMGAVTWDLLH